jgi:hypothetical protein
MLVVKNRPPTVDCCVGNICRLWALGFGLWARRSVDCKERREV